MELLVMILAFLVAALAGVLAKRRVVLGVVSVAAAAAAFLSAIALALRVATTGTYTPYPIFTIDALGAITLLIITCVGLAASVYSIPYLKQEQAKQIIGFTRIKQYCALLSLFIVAMVLTIASSSPLFTWICLEATTLTTAFLISFYNKPSAMEAAWKYLIINSVGLLLALFGTLLYFTAARHVGGGLVTWEALRTHATQLDPAIIKLAFVFVLIGYGTKVGLVPMHTWLPDAHSKAPSPISALLSGVLLNVALVVVLRFSGVTSEVVGQAFSHHLLIAFGLLSVLFAAVIIVTQKSYKRLLAYSSIENMGIIALGVGFGGLGAFAAVLHMVYHSLIKSSLFLVSGNMLLKYSSAHIKKVKGALSALPVTGVLFFVGLFAATGFPPFGVFFTELFTIGAGLRSYLPVSILALAALTLVFIGFFRAANTMSFGDKPDEVVRGETSLWLVAPPLALLALVLVLTFYMPPFMTTLIKEASAGL